uniref:Uncharacterized protein n=1 Tax=Meloidogyne enterolobii TaxID=390850 RepID=A0A6V7XD09_MELEN|nr:unnamed protein product [Meloidogyne enterolobii]
MSIQPYNTNKKRRRNHPNQNNFQSTSSNHQGTSSGTQPPLHNFPIVFTSPGRAIFPVKFCPVLPTFCSNIANVWHSIKFSSGVMTSLVIDKRYRTGKDFIAYSLVLLAKWLMFGQKIHISGLRHYSTNHLTSVIAIIKQYGSFRIDNIGFNFQLVDAHSIIHSIVRIAFYLNSTAKKPQKSVEIFNEPDIHPEDLYHINLWWLPTKNNCPLFKFWLTLRLSDAYGKLCPGISLSIESVSSSLFPIPKTNDFMDDTEDEQNLNVENTERQKFPIWFSHFISLLPEEEKTDWDWIFKPFPSQEDFVALFSGLEGERRQARIDIPVEQRWKKPKVADLGWELNLMDVFNEVSNIWLPFSLNLSRFMNMESIENEVEEAFGSLTQISLLSNEHGITSLRTLHKVSLEKASLAAAFHPEAIWDQLSHNPRVLYITSNPPKVEGTRWVQKRDIKNYN